MITQDIKQKVGEYKPLDTFIGNWERELCVGKGGDYVWEGRGIMFGKGGGVCVGNGGIICKQGELCLKG